jgi:hypothetical protein
VKNSFLGKNIKNQPPQEKQRITELLWVNIIGFLISFFLLGGKIIFWPELICLPCDLGIILVFGIALFLLYFGRPDSALNLTFLTPFFIYGYYLSDFHDHLPPTDTVYYSLWWIIVALVYLCTFALNFKKIFLFSAVAVLTLFYHISIAGWEKYLSADQNFVSNPIIFWYWQFLQRGLSGNFLNKS